MHYYFPYKLADFQKLDDSIEITVDVPKQVFLLYWHITITILRNSKCPCGA